MPPGGNGTGMRFTMPYWWSPSFEMPSVIGIIGLILIVVILVAMIKTQSQSHRKK